LIGGVEARATESDSASWSLSKVKDALAASQGWQVLRTIVDISGSGVFTIDNRDVT